MNEGADPLELPCVGFASRIFLLPGALKARFAPGEAKNTLPGAKRGIFAPGTNRRTALTLTVPSCKKNDYL